MALSISLVIDVDTGGESLYEVTLYSNSASHNFAPMWEEAEIIDILYGDQKDLQAGDIVDRLAKSISFMSKNPSKFMKMQAAEYETFDDALSFLTELYRQCVEHPNSTVVIVL